MRRYWNEVAGPRWVGRQAIQEARNAEMLALLLEAAAPAPGERVLDIGFGTGVTTVPFAEAVGAAGHVTGSIFPGRCSTQRSAASPNRG